LSIYDLQVLSSDNYKFGYNAATGKYEDLMASGIIDPTKASFVFHGVIGVICVFIFLRLFKNC